MTVSIRCYEKYAIDGGSQITDIDLPDSSSSGDNPKDPEVGDLIIINICSQNNSGTENVEIPSGFTEIADAGDADSDCKVRSYWKIASSDNLSNPISLETYSDKPQASSYYYVQVIVLLITGHDPANPIHDVGTPRVMDASFNNPLIEHDFSWPTNPEGCLLLGVIGLDDSNDFLYYGIPYDNDKTIFTSTDDDWDKNLDGCLGVGQYPLPSSPNTANWVTILDSNYGYYYVTYAFIINKYVAASSSPSGSPSAGTPSGSPSEGTPSDTPSASPSEGTPSNSPSEGTPSGTPSASPESFPLVYNLFDERPDTLTGAADWTFTAGEGCYTDGWQYGVLNVKDIQDVYLAINVRTYHPWDLLQINFIEKTEGDSIAINISPMPEQTYVSHDFYYSSSNPITLQDYYDDAYKPVVSDLNPEDYSSLFFWVSLINSGDTTLTATIYRGRHGTFSNAELVYQCDFIYKGISA